MGVLRNKGQSLVAYLAGLNQAKKDPVNVALHAEMSDKFRTFDGAYSEYLAQTSVSARSQTGDADAMKALEHAISKGKTHLACFQEYVKKREGNFQ